MSAHVLFNLFKELRKRDQMRDLSSILSLFRIKFNEFNNRGARMSLKLLVNHIFGMKTQFCHLLHNVKMDIIT